MAKKDDDNLEDFGDLDDFEDLDNFDDLEDLGEDDADEAALPDGDITLVEEDDDIADDGLDEAGDLDEGFEEAPETVDTVIEEGGIDSLDEDELGTVDVGDDADELSSLDDDELGESTMDFDEEEIPRERVEVGKKSSAKQKSPVTNRGRSSRGLGFMWVFLFVLVMGGLGFFYYPHVMMTYTIELLADHERLNSEDMTSERWGKTKDFLNQYKDDFGHRIDYLMLDPLSKRKVFACRVITNYALKDIANQQRVDATITKLADIADNQDPTDELFVELINDITSFRGRQNGNKLGAEKLSSLANSQNLTAYRKQLVSYELSKYHGADMIQLLQDTIRSLQDKESQDKSMGRDLDGACRLILCRELCKRLEAQTREVSNPHQEDEAFADQMAQLEFLIDLYSNDQDQRVREAAYSTLSGLKNARSVELWASLLERKDNIVIRHLALNQLRQISGRSYDFEVYNPDADNSAWKDWASDYNPTAN